MSPELAFGIYLVGVMLWAFVVALADLDYGDLGIPLMGLFWPALLGCVLFLAPIVGPWLLGRWLHGRFN